MPPKIPSTIAVDISNKQQFKTVGGQMSKRLPINVKMEDGSIVKGFYTENIYTNFIERYNAAIEEAKNRVKSEIPDSGAYIALINDIQKNIHPSVFFAALSKGTKADTTEDIDKKNVFGEENTWTRFTLEAMKEYNSSFGDANQYMKLFSNKTFGDIMKGLAKEGLSLGGAIPTMLGVAKQEKGKVTINKRNNALYQVSEKIGDSDLICKSVNMVTTNNGVQNKGTFMVNAKGTDLKNIKPVIKKTSKGSYPMQLFFSSTAIRDMSKLQVIDYLTANVDRHYGNMFYNMECVKGDSKKRIPDKMVITSLQGIDNDLSFGALDGKSRVSYMSKLQDIKIIDKQQAEGIMKMKPEEFEAIMREAGLGRTEVEAGLNRLQNLQEAIKTNKITQVEGKGWDKIKPNDYAIVNERRTNIFGLAKEVIAIYNERKNEAITLDQFFESKKEQPSADVSEIKNESENLLYQSQLDDLLKLKEDFNKTNPEKASPEFKKMYDGLTDLISVIQTKAINNNPDAMAINFISVQYKKLEDASANYISLKRKVPFSDNGKERLHLAKNMLQQTKTGRHMVLEESTASFERRMRSETNKVYEKYQSLIEIDNQLKEKSDNATPEFLADQVKKINAMSDNFKDDKTFDKIASGLEKIILNKLGKEKSIELLGVEELKKSEGIINKRQEVRSKDVENKELLHDAPKSQETQKNHDNMGLGF